MLRAASAGVLLAALPFLTGNAQPVAPAAPAITPEPSIAPAPAAMAPERRWLLQSYVEAALASPTLAGAHVGVLIVDAVSDSVLYARNADDDFVPASTLKLVAGSAALSRLGPAFAFATDVDAAGTVENGTLQGDLYLRGGGDAQLSVADLGAAATAVQAAGISRVSGALIGDASRYDAPHYPLGWAIDDIPYEYAAVPGALCVDLNVAHVRVAPGDAPGTPASLQESPQTGAFALENATVTGAPGSTDETDVARPWDRPRVIRVTGSYPLGAPLSDDLEPAVPDPAEYTVDLFRKALEAHGVTLEDGVAFGSTPPGATVVWAHRSKPLGLLLRDFWPPSKNLIGEQLLEELGTEAALHAIPGDARGADTRARGISNELDWLRAIGIDPATVSIADGSGLSAYDRLTPRALVAVLQADWHGRQRDVVVNALAVAGISGTLRSTFAQPPLAGAIYAKTGTSNHARLLAGYARTVRGGTVIFALMVNNWMDSSADAAAALDRARGAILTAVVTQ
ncbi:MAG: D-alanyl-D-alanine carboxypeptidase/D-alanyl-D-alanine-endopeptidase [Candidatus Tumulicola sp.]